MKIKASELVEGLVIIVDGKRLFVSNIETDSIKYTVWHAMGRVRFHKDDLVEVL